MGIVILDVSVDGGLKIDDANKDAALEAALFFSEATSVGMSMKASLRTCPGTRTCSMQARAEIRASREAANETAV